MKKSRGVPNIKRAACYLLAAMLVCLLAGCASAFTMNGFFGKLAVMIDVNVLLPKLALGILCLVVLCRNACQLSRLLRIKKHGTMYRARRIGYRYNTYNKGSFDGGSNIESRHTPIYEFETDGITLRAQAIDFWSSYREAPKLIAEHPVYDYIYHLDAVEGCCVIVGKVFVGRYTAMVAVFSLLLALVLAW